KQRVVPRSTVICQQPPIEACRLARKFASQFLPPINQCLFALQTADQTFVTASSTSRSGPRAIWELGIRVLSRFALRCFSMFVRNGAAMRGARKSALLPKKIGICRNIRQVTTSVVGQRNTRIEQMFSALPPTTDIRRR